MLGQLRFQSVIVFMVMVGLTVLLNGCLHKDEKPMQQQTPIDSNTLKQVDQLNETAEEMYRKVSEGDVQQAREKLQQMGTQVTSMRFNGLTSMEGVNALNESIVSAMKVFNAVKFSLEDGQLAAAKIRLATDALKHTHHPMWLQYHKVMNEAWNRLDKAANAQNKQAATEMVRLMEVHFSIIQPAVLINRDPSEAEKMKSLFTFLNSQLSAENIDYKFVHSGVKQLKLALDHLFNQKDDQTAYVPMMEQERPVYGMVAIGSIIIAALIYTAWRMVPLKQNTMPIGRKPKQ